MKRKLFAHSRLDALLVLLALFEFGYHQEHHYRPQVHWTRIPEVKKLLPSESQRRVVRWAHWFNL
jgi:fatty acid desaturase